MDPRSRTAWRRQSAPAPLGADDAPVVGLVGDDEPQPAVIAAPTAAIRPSIARRLNRFECGMSGPLCKASACGIEQIVHNLRRARTVALRV